MEKDNKTCHFETWNFNLLSSCGETHVKNFKKHLQSSTVMNINTYNLGFDVLVTLIVNKIIIHKKLLNNLK